MGIINSISNPPSPQTPQLLLSDHYKKPLREVNKSSGCELEYKINVAISELHTPFMTVEEYTVHPNHTGLDWTGKFYNLNLTIYI